MASGYRLRLGDGTSVLLDDKGLATWLQGGLVDEKTRVQPAGSKQWLTIRQLMVALEQHFQVKNLASEKLLMKDGNYVPDQKVGDIARFLQGELVAA